MVIISEGKIRQGLALGVGVGPSFFGFGVGPSQGRGWLFLLGVRSAIWVRVGPSFSGEGWPFLFG